MTMILTLFFESSYHKNSGDYFVLTLMERFTSQSTVSRKTNISWEVYMAGAHSLIWNISGYQQTWWLLQSQIFFFFVLVMCAMFDTMESQCNLLPRTTQVQYYQLYKVKTYTSHQDDQGTYMDTQTFHGRTSFITHPHPLPPRPPTPTLVRGPSRQPSRTGNMVRCVCVYIPHVPCSMFRVGHIYVNV